MQYKVVVVDDSPFMRKIISDLIERDPLFKVVGTATNGLEALTLVKKLKPDIVTMDVEMPEMNGLEALKIIMKDNPIPVIMLSGINEDGLRETILALESGAFDFIRKPSAVVSNDIVQVGEVLLEKMKAAMHAKERRIARKAEELARSEKKVEPKRKLEPINRTDALPANIVSRKKEVLPKANMNTKQVTRNGIINDKVTDEKPTNSTKQKKPTAKIPAPTKPLWAMGSETSQFQHLIAIGCSTGGPRALKEVLERMPGDLPGPVVIVQHMPPKFTKSLAQRLNTFSALEVVEGEHGMVLNRGYAYIAPGGYQMKIEQSSVGHYEICLTEEEPRNGHRPSVEVMFDSLLPFTLLKRHLVLLTGMGSDGAQAMKRLYESGVTDTYAESEETCVVYGMPRSAVELNCVKHILPLQEIPLQLIQTLK
ncbi:protein-glutamate methylesterase/protein-glutamine glutaminase [Paenibacillus sp. FA6]|uniref:protein-glutamate methylesterase/protein-glutamine glutaminase n=1 Tax=Paenibacillus sp. FA6 TaxID=3413029 RepID=UPI003F65E95B